MAPCHAFKPFLAALASFLHQTLASRLLFARDQTLLKSSAALWAGQTATAAPLYGIPKLTDGTLPRLQTLLGSFGLIPAPNPCLKIAVCPPPNSSHTLRSALGKPDCHHSTHSETDGWHPATPSNPSRQLWPHSSTKPLPQDCLATVMPECHLSTSLWHSETDGWHPNPSRQLWPHSCTKPLPQDCRFPAIKLSSYPPRRLGQARLPPQHLFMAFRN